MNQKERIPIVESGCQIKSVSEVSVIRVVVVGGSGVSTDPFRDVEIYYTKDGERIARVDRLEQTNDEAEIARRF